MHDKEKEQRLLLCSTLQLDKAWDRSIQTKVSLIEYFLQHVLCPEEHYECALAVKLLQPWGVKKLAGWLIASKLGLYYWLGRVDSVPLQ